MDQKTLDKIASIKKLAYYAGPVMHPQVGFGWYVVIRAEGRQEIYLVRDIAGQIYMTKLDKQSRVIGKVDGLVYVAMPEDICYDYSQINAAAYDTCKCGMPKAKNKKRCPLCLFDIRLSVAIHDIKVIERHETEKKRKKNGKGQPAVEAETDVLVDELDALDELRQPLTKTTPKPITIGAILGWAAKAVTSWKRQPEPQMVQLELWEPD